MRRPSSPNRNEESRGIRRSRLVGHHRGTASLESMGGGCPIGYDEAWKTASGGEGVRGIAATSPAAFAKAFFCLFRSSEGFCAAAAASLDATPSRRTPYWRARLFRLLPGEPRPGGVGGVGGGCIACRPRGHATPGCLAADPPDVWSWSPCCPCRLALTRVKRLAGFVPNLPGPRCALGCAAAGSPEGRSFPGRRGLGAGLALHPGLDGQDVLASNQVSGSLSRELVR